MSDAKATDNLLLDAAARTEEAIAYCRKALDQIADTPSRLAIGQGILRLQEGRHEIRNAREMLRDLGGLR